MVTGESYTNDFMKFSVNKHNSSEMVGGSAKNSDLEKLCLP